MRQTIATVTFLVRDYDEAIRWFTEVLRFRLVGDTPLGGGKRWVLVEPPGATGTHLLLARAADEDEASFIGRQAGGRVFLFLNTDDFWRDYEDMRARGVSFYEEPRHEPYGIVAVFEDLYGNYWDLIEPKAERKGERT
jgi:catechol 2,3-dioxygenase-like lactoylglutathione lyase family enzyme